MQPNEQAPWGLLHQEQCRSGQATGQESDINTAEDASQARCWLLNEDICYFWAGVVFFPHSLLFSKYKSSSGEVYKEEKVGG